MGQGKVRCRQIDEAKRDNQTDDPHQKKGQKPVMMHRDRRDTGPDQKHPTNGGRRRNGQKFARTSGVIGFGIETRKPDGYGGKDHDRQITLQRSVLKIVGNHATKRHDLDDQTIKHCLCIRPRQVGGYRHQAAMTQKNKRTGNQGNHAHAKCRGQAVPKCQMIFRKVPPRDRIGRGRNQRSGNGRREQTDQNHQNRQKCGRCPHAKRRVMGMMGQFVTGFAKPDMEDKAQRIGDREHRTNRCQQRYKPVLIEPDGMPCFFQHHFLGQEPVQRNDPGHRCRRNDPDGPGNRHQVQQPAQTADIARSGLMVNDPGGHEQGRLEGCMVDDMKHARNGGHRRSETKQHGHKTKMADGGVRQKPLKVMFENRNPGAQHHGHEARTRHDIEPFLRSRKNRPHARHQEDTRLDHGRRMQIGRNWGRCGHGMRQPEMERELCRFGKAAQQDQNKGWHIKRRRLDQVGILQDHRQIIGPDDISKDQHPGNHRKSACPGHGQRHTRALTTFGQMLPVTDQKEG